MSKSQDQVWANLKKDVRSLLLSSKLGLSEEQLKKDYRAMLGHGLPLRDLGLRSVRDMAQQMPDVMTLSYLLDGCLVLKAVCDESTRGINQLVSRQRSKTKSKMGGPLRAYPPYRPPVPLILRRGPPTLPAQLRAQLRQLISQGPLRLSELESGFQRCFGRPLHFTDHGFYSLGDMLAHMPDLSIRYTRLGSLISLKQPDAPRPPPPPSGPQSRTQPGPQRRPQPGPQSSSQSRHKVPRTGFIKARVVEPSPICSSSKPDQPRPPDPLPSEPSPAPSPCGPGPGTTQSSPAVSCQNVDLIGHGSKWVPDSGTPPEDAPKPPGPERETVLLERLMFELEAELSRKIRENGEAGSVSPELRSKLQEVVGEHSEGLSVHDLPTHYQRVFGEELPFLQCGFLSITALVGALSDVFHLEPAGGARGPDWVVKNINTSSIREAAECGEEEGRWMGGGQYQSSLWDQHGDEEEEEQSDTTTCPVLSLAHQQLYPGVQVHVRPGSRVPLDAVQGQRLGPPTRRWPRGLAAVLVERVESPGSFHVRFSESQETRALEGMMMEMRGVYSSADVAERYALPHRYLRQGQVCCVAPQGLWFYRVVLQRLLSPLQAEVYYVDFGDLNLVSVDQLLFLKSCYSQLPAQAIPASLAGVQPVSGVWSAAATAAFQELSRDRPLVAVLQGYHGNALQLFLCDTHTDEDRYAHTVLMEQGHARPRPQPPLATDAGDALQRLCLGQTLVDLEEEENTPTTVTHQPTKGQQGRSSGQEEESLPELPSLELVEAFHRPPQPHNPCESERNPSADQDSGPPGRPGPPEPADPQPTAPPPCGGDPPHPLTGDPAGSRSASPPLCNGNNDTWSRPKEEPGPVMTPDPFGAPPTSLSSLPPIMTSLSLLTPGLAKGCFYGLGSLRSSGSSVCFPLFGSRRLACANGKRDLLVPPTASRLLIVTQPLPPETGQSQCRR